MVPDLKDLPAIFPLLGLLLALYYVWGVLDFLWFHYLRPRSWDRFLHGQKPYALITGATDGIGKSTAKELYAKGFSLVLHGRSEEKMKRTVEEVRSSNPTSGLDVKYFIADASRPDVDSQGIARQFGDLNITLFVNNVGGSPVANKLLDQLDEEIITSVMNINARFPYLITRAFLPLLRRNSQNGPVEVVFIGSLSGEVPVPFISPYAGSKMLTKRVSLTLQSEERILTKSKLSFVYVNIGEVQTGAFRAEASLARPRSDDFAKHLVESFGSGRGVVIPHPTHHVIYSIVTGMPEILRDYIVSAASRNAFKKFQEGMKDR